MFVILKFFFFSFQRVRRVQKLKRISDCGYVSLIGESWGGIVALKMAQILEAQGTLVSVALLEGDPGSLAEWAEYYLTKVNIAHKLNVIYGSFSSEVNVTIISWSPTITVTTQSISF